MFSCWKFLVSLFAFVFLFVCELKRLPIVGWQRLNICISPPSEAINFFSAGAKGVIFHLFQYVGIAVIAATATPVKSDDVGSRALRA